MSGEFKWLNGTAISNKLIMLEYSITNGETWNEVTRIQTNDDGSYFYSWKPTAYGNFLFRTNLLEEDLDWIRVSSAQANVTTLPVEKDIDKDWIKEIPGFMIESIMVGMLLGIILLLYARNIFCSQLFLGPLILAVTLFLNSVTERL
jgi:hypothetical protein